MSTMNGRVPAISHASDGGDSEVHRVDNFWIGSAYRPGHLEDVEPSSRSAVCHFRRAVDLLGDAFCAFARGRARPAVYQKLCDHTGHLPSRSAHRN